MGTSMKIELKNIKYSEWASQETPCYEASVYVDGKKIGYVGNDGHGGCDVQHIKPDMLASLNQWCAENLPRSEYDGVDLGPADFETLCSDLLTKHLLRKDYLRASESKILFTIPNKPGVYQISRKSHPDAAIVAHIRQKHGSEATILNNLPEAQALELYANAA